MKTKWRKVGNEWLRGPLWVGRSGGLWWHDVHLDKSERHQFWSGFLTPEAAMRAADRWAARMLKALRKLEGDKTRRKP